ncbi:17206_t:CDS:2, partial [Rhizophagus irregularis]
RTDTYDQDCKPVCSATDDSDEIELTKNQNVELDLIRDLQSCVIVPSNEQHSSSNEACDQTTTQNLIHLFRKATVEYDEPDDDDEPGDDDYKVDAFAGSLDWRD